MGKLRRLTSSRLSMPIGFLMLAATFKLSAFAREAFITSRFGLSSVTDAYFSLQQLPLAVAAFMFGPFCRAFTPALADARREQGKVEWLPGLLMYGTIFGLVLTALALGCAPLTLRLFTRATHSDGWPTLAVLSLCYWPIVQIGLFTGIATSYGRNIHALASTGLPYLLMTLVLGFMYWAGRLNNLSLPISMTAGFGLTGLLSITLILAVEKPFRCTVDFLRPWKQAAFCKFAGQLAASSLENIGYSVNQMLILFFMTRAGTGAISANNCSARIGLLGFSLLVQPLTTLLQARLCTTTGAAQKKTFRNYLLAMAAGSITFALLIGMFRYRVAGLIYLHGKFSIAALNDVAALLPAWLSFFVIVSLNSTVGQYLFRTAKGRIFTRNMLCGYGLANIIRFATAGASPPWIIWCSAIGDGAALLANLLNSADVWRKPEARENLSQAPLLLRHMFVSENKNKANVAVLGLGYVGCVTAACLAKLGHRVVGVDRDIHKVQKVLAGQPPFHEPGLGEIVQEVVASGLLTANDNLATAIHDCEIAMICVGTPSEANGNMSLAQLQRACEEIAGFLPGRSKPLIVVVRSTVFPGTCEELVLPAVGVHALVSVVSNPEFLREGSAVKDFLDPSLLVVGGTDQAAARRVAELYQALDAEPLVVSLRAAEMIKYACNCFHAVKIAFANEIGTVCARLGIGPQEVMQTLCADVRLNISPAYLKPGFAFGGSCLPKDLRALTYRASRLDLSLPMLQNVLLSNEAHMKRATDTVLSLKAECIGIFGLAFKEDTDDLRESSVVTLVEHLIGKGKDLRIFDPQIKIDKIYGKNRQFALNAVPHIGRLMAATVDEMLAAADHIIVTQRPSKEFRDVLAASGKPVLNLTDVSSYAASQEGPLTADGSASLPALAKRLMGDQPPQATALSRQGG